jgi:hypothetical protein
MRTLLLTAIFVLFAGSFAALAQESNNPPGQQDSADPGTAPSDDKRGTDTAPFVVKIYPSPEDKAEAEANKAEREQAARNEGQLVEFTRQLVVATYILGGFTCLLFIVTGGLVYFARRQARDMNETIRLSLESIGVARQTERAYFYPAVSHNFNEGLLSAERFDKSFDMQVEKFKASVHFTNFGKSPAVIRAIVVSEIIISEDQPGTFSKVVADRPEDRDMVASGGTSADFKVQMIDPRTVAEVAPICSGVASIWFRLRIYYDDIFREKHGQQFTFRFRRKDGIYYLEIRDDLPGEG